MSDITSLQKRAQEINEKYGALNTKQGTPAWGIKDRAMGFSVDVGELTELIMAKEQMRSVQNLDAKFTHELADCLWSLLVIAEHYGIDLGSAFTSTMDELDERIKKASI